MNDHKVDIMKERPILFSAPMVRAILDGRKTQTRRVVKGEALRWLNDGFTPKFVADYQNRLCPYGKPGDHLWVRETFHTVDGHSAFYRADYEHNPKGDKEHGIVWTPSIHMPRWASRISLKIIGVRVERLQDISEKDAWAEGCEGFDDDVSGGKSGYCEYAELWEEINGKGSWDANPWVWVIKFKSPDVPQCEPVARIDSPVRPDPISGVLYRAEVTLTRKLDQFTDLYTAPPVVPAKPCNWTQDYDDAEQGAWKTDCDNYWYIIDGTPSDNKMKFCHGCGKPIMERPYAETEEEK